MSPAQALLVTPGLLVWADARGGGMCVLMGG